MLIGWRDWWRFGKISKNNFIVFFLDGEICNFLFILSNILGNYFFRENFNLFFVRMFNNGDI